MTIVYPYNSAELLETFAMLTTTFSAQGVLEYALQDMTFRFRATETHHT
jgi:hypothetical protein